MSLSCSEYSAVATTHGSRRVQRVCQLLHRHCRFSGEPKRCVYPPPLRARAHRSADVLERRPRTDSTRLISPGLSPAVIRDQKPMKFLAEKLEPGTSLEDFLAAINARVFFWPNRDRLDRLRNAKEYRAEEQVILHVDTRRLVERYEHQIQLCRFNSGAVTQRNHPLRGRDSWVPIGRFPYEEDRRKHGRGNALAEVTVLDAVPDIVDLTVDWSSDRSVDPDVVFGIAVASRLRLIAARRRLR